MPFSLALASRFGLWFGKHGAIGDCATGLWREARILASGGDFWRSFWKADNAIARCSLLNVQAEGSVSSVDVCG
uniref:Uncharacterized protein n=1 Tax=Rhizophora mucronata TaxID=61149 RepID=A0A2P2P528_RHIMU